jgi:DNA-directed RNA polymerase subunit beta
VAAERWNFSKIKEVISIPNLIEIQRRSFDQFLQMKVPPHTREEIGLQGAFASIFPIYNYDQSASLDFVKYEFGAPKYRAEESLEKGMTYSVPLKVTLRLMVWAKCP